MVAGDPAAGPPAAVHAAPGSGGDGGVVAPSPVAVGINVGTALLAAVAPSVADKPPAFAAIATMAAFASSLLVRGGASVNTPLNGTAQCTCRLPSCNTASVGRAVAGVPPVGSAVSVHPAADASGGHSGGVNGGVDGGVVRKQRSRCRHVNAPNDVSAAAAAAAAAVAT